MVARHAEVAWAGRPRNSGQDARAPSDGRLMVGLHFHVPGYRMGSFFGWAYEGPVFTTPLSPQGLDRDSSVGSDYAVPQGRPCRRPTVESRARAGDHYAAEVYLDGRLRQPQEAVRRSCPGALCQSLGPGRPHRQASLGFGHGEAGFAMNRRARTNGEMVIGVNKHGPVDYDVPVLRIDDKHGKVRAVVFGYACHNTTAQDFLQFNGDYAGYAQAWLEKQHPGATALFIAGCGGDANPYPRGTVELAQQHGEELAAAVEKVLVGKLEPVHAPLNTAYEEFAVAFATPPGREELQAQLENNDVYRHKWAEAMLKILDRDGHLPTEYPYPLEIWQFGQDLTLIALAGEVVVDYDLRLKKELGAEKLWVAAYCNDVFAYIPSLRVLREGGYEGGGAMVYYGQPGPFAPTIEETIIGKVRDMIGRVRGEIS
jgi:hypothetical protein